MGWKGAVRSLNAAARAAERENQKQQRALGRALNAVDRQESTAAASLEKDDERLTEKVARYEQALKQNLIKTMNLQWTEQEGFTADPFILDGKILKGELSLLTARDGPAPPDARLAPYVGESYRIAVLEVLLTRWATVVIFEVENSDPEYRIRPTWRKASAPSESPVFIVGDRDYYYPLASTLGGEVLPGVPKVGMMAFEPFRQPCVAFDIHFSDVKLTSKRGEKLTFKFHCADDDVAETTSQVSSEPSLVEEFAGILAKSKRDAAQEVQALVDSARNDIVQSAQASSSNGLWAAAFVVACVVIAVATNC